MPQFLRLSEENFRNITVRMHPKRTYRSGSGGLGVTGSIFLFPYTSSVEYVQIRTDSTDDDYPTGSWWGPATGSSGILAKWISGSSNMNPAKGTLPVVNEALFGNSIHNIDQKDTTDLWFITKSNVEFFIKRNTPLSDVEYANVLEHNDIYTWANAESSDGARFWQISGKKPYSVGSTQIIVDESKYTSDRWFTWIDSDSHYEHPDVGELCPPLDDGVYFPGGGGTEGERSIVAGIFSKLGVSKNVQKLRQIVGHMPYYLVENPAMLYAYCNYHCLNFFTSSAVNSNAAIIYRSPQETLPDIKYEKDELSYGVSSSFTFEFWIKPTGPQNMAGTILHYSGNYALSLISASVGTYETGDERYKLLLQLSSSSRIAPSEAIVVANSESFVFTSSNALRQNYWHHVAVRWDKDRNKVGNTSRGDFIIDGKIDSNFYISSSLLSNVVGAGSQEINSGLRAWIQNYIVGNSYQNDPRQLIVGNYFDGDVIYGGTAGSYFNDTKATEEGINGDGLIADTDITDAAFRHPLNAEIHEIRIWKDWRPIEDIQQYSGSGLPKDIVVNASSSGLRFYAPLLFIEQTSWAGKYKYTPKMTQDALLSDVDFDNSATEIHPYPINVPLAYGTNGHEINVPNFVRDFARKQKNLNRSGMPRLFNFIVPAKTAEPTHSRQAANEILESPIMLRRNLSLLPCDNGKFVPNWDLCSVFTASADVTYPYGINFGEAYLKNKCVESAMTPNPPDITYDYSWINLNNLSPTRDIAKDENIKFVYDLDRITASYGHANPPKGYFINTEPIVTPKHPCYPHLYVGRKDDGLPARPIYYIADILSSSKSNTCVFYNIPNLFYGKQISPGSFALRDANITGSMGGFYVTLKDDGRGGLYRGDAKTEHATWNNVGNIFYNEGIALIKSPHLYWFGKDRWEMYFSGTSDVYTQIVEFGLPANMFNSSSNSGYREFVSDSPAKREPNVIVSNINFYDDKYNVMAKCSLSQPIAKEKNKDKFFFRLKTDF